MTSINNPNKHCYVGLDNKPYIDQFGVPFSGRKEYAPQEENHNRSIVRTNRPIEEKICINNICYPWPTMRSD